LQGVQSVKKRKRFESDRRGDHGSPGDFANKITSEAPIFLYFLAEIPQFL